MIDVCLLGCGGMMPLPDRYLTSLLVRHDGRCLLIDCGEGTQLALRRSGFSFKNIDNIFLTHFHADHTAGLPGLLLTMGNCDRTEPVMIYGPPGVNRIVNAVLSLCGNLPFDVYGYELTDKSEINIGKLRVKNLAVEHRVTCYAYSIELDRQGKFDPAKAQQLGIPIKMWKILQSGNSVENDDGTVWKPEDVLGPQRKGLKLSYCTDTRPVRRLDDFVMDSDLFICEGMYGDKDKLQSVREKKHMLFSEAATIAVNANVGELWLTHYSPALEDPQEYLYMASDIFPNTQAGHNVKKTTLYFE